MFMQTDHTVGFFGHRRKKVLKDSFRTIIDNIVPGHVKSYKMLYNQGTVDKFLDQYVKRRDSSRKHKFCKVKDETILDIFSKYTFSDSVIKSWRADKGMRKNTFKLEE